ncbi:hypothetical protein N7478_001793 [Penicillium angulare]|uniref:uncharacterized protein n=1 Tax=Penicillium angulare TaxID=116970 RepID=UPI00254137EA|nr:uncharacterized protein N7478_001793 [Penicillium angulare]KAJ5288763.1 hypothetical protein N7478_001793 [Penicillium angulare]
MGKNTDDRPAYLSADDAKYSLGVHRGPLVPTGVGDASKLEKVETAGGLSLATTQSRKEKFSRHWKRFWCCYLIGNVIFLAIFLPVFFLVAIPAISQLVVNKSNLVLVSAAVMQPLPNHIQLTLLSALDLKIALPVRIDPIDLNLFIADIGADKPWGQANLTGMTIRGNTTLGVTDQSTPLLNTTVWTDYVRQVVNQKETALGVKGTTDSFLGVLKSKVTMDKSVLSPTLNSFEGFSINDASLIPAEADGTNLNGTVILPNPSILTLEIGTIVLDVMSGNLTIGNATIENLTLKPGNHSNPLKGSLDIGIILKHIKQILADQLPSIKSSGGLNLTSVTRSVTYNGTEVPYYTEVMSELPLSATVGLLDTLKNTLSSFLQTGSGKSLAEVVAELKNHTSGENITDLVDDLKDGLDVSSLKSRDTSRDGLTAAQLLSRTLRLNPHVRKLFKDESTDQRDEMLDSLAGWYLDQH